MNRHKTNRQSSIDHRQRSAGGFTLLEILVVVMIITILATIVGVSVSDRPGQARVVAAKAQIGTFKQALQMYRMDQGRYPAQEQGLKALCERPQAQPVPERYPESGYLDSRNLPKDPWGNDYIYLIPGPQGASFEIVTYGADGEIGGQGEAADISSQSL